MAGIEPDHTEIRTEFGSSGSNQSGMRAHNERLVLTILRRHGALPKATIARITGLSAQTVSVIMRALEADGLIARGEKLRGKIGQPSVPMQLNPDGALFLGLKVGRRSAELTLVDFVGQVRAHDSRTYRFPTPVETLAFVQSATAAMLDELPDDLRQRVSGMGIAIPYFLWEWAETNGVETTEMAAWKDFDLRKEVATMFDFPVYLGNDATSACGAELVFGTSDLPSDFLYVYIGYFVGGGVVLNGSVYEGSRGNAGAIGPFPVIDSRGVTRQLVHVASLIGLEQRQAEAHGDVSALWDNPDIWDINRDIVDDWLDEAIPALATTVLGTVSIIDFPRVVVDGQLPEPLRAEIVARIDQELRQRNLSGLTAPDITQGTIGRRARSLGAASLPLARKFMLE